MRMSLGDLASVSRAAGKDIIMLTIGEILAVAVLSGMTILEGVSLSFPLWQHLL